MNKKAITLLLSFFLPLAFLQAQSMDSIPHHYVGPYFNISPETIMQTGDGNILGGVHLTNITSGYIIYSEGYVMQKLARNGAMITDTTFIRYKYFPSHFTGRNPFTSGNVYAELGDFVDPQSFLRIRFFDDDLIFDTTRIEVPLCNNPIGGAKPCMLLNAEGDLVTCFYEYNGYMPGDVHFAQIGLDGTIKCHETYSSEQIQVGSATLNGPKVFRDSPLQYSCWASNGIGLQTELKCYILDSLFNLCETYSIPVQISNAPQWPYHVYFLEYSRNVFVTGDEDGTFLMTAAYDNSGTLQGGSGMVLARFDNEGNKIKCVGFPTLEPMQDSYEWPIGIEKGTDGCIYLCYTISSSEDGTVCVMKLDYDFNVIWQRYCLASGYGKDNAIMSVLSDNGMAILGNVYNGTELFYVVINDDYDGLQEQDDLVRPYMFYPNPAQDQLHINYSPDVQPKLLELYDMQGRLVHQQRDGLENLNLQGLATGQYVMKVTMEDGTTYSDKVVKE